MKDIGIIGSILKRVAKGDLTQLVEIPKLEDKKIGENINKIIENFKRKENELRQTKLYSENLIRNTPAPIILFTPQGIGIDCNPAMEKLIGKKKEELLEGVEEIYAPESREGGKKIIEEAVEKGYSSKELEIIRRDEAHLSIAARASIIKDMGGNPFVVIYSATDITELKNKEVNLKNAITSFGEILSSAASGDLTAKVDLSTVSKEYKQIGKDINKMISVTEHNITELRKREEELTNASCDVAEIMEAISAGDYQKRVSEDYSLPEVVNLTKAMNVVMGSLERSDEELKAFIKELATPAIEAVEGVVVMPLVGKLTSDRALDAMEVLLNKLEEVRGKAGIIDITGVSGVDSAVADNLIRTMESIKLFGAEPLITGVSGKTAQNLARLGIKFDFITKSTLAEGLRYALRVIRQEEKERGL
jgi:PAS domain S-box-containing protein